MAHKTPASEQNDTLTGAASETAKTTSPVPRGASAKADIMRRKLEAQPKVPIMIPLAPGETEGSTQSVILNGHRVNIRKGMYVHVPQQIAEVVMESQRQTRQAIQNYFAMDGNGVSAAMREKSITSA